MIHSSLSANHAYLQKHLSVKIGMSDRFAYSAPPTAGGQKAEARKGRKGREGLACESTPGVRQHANRGPTGSRSRSRRHEAKRRVGLFIISCELTSQTPPHNFSLQPNISRKNFGYSR